MIIQTIEDYKRLEFNNINLSASKLFEFVDYYEWINRATLCYGNIGLSKEEIEQYCITLDSKGRLCRKGGDFMRASYDNSFPISVYLLEFTL